MGIDEKALKQVKKAGRNGAALLMASFVLPVVSMWAVSWLLFEPRISKQEAAIEELKAAIGKIDRRIEQVNEKAALVESAIASAGVVAQLQSIHARQSYLLAALTHLPDDVWISQVQSEGGTDLIQGRAWQPSAIAEAAAQLSDAEDSRPTRIDEYHLTSSAVYDFTLRTGLRAAP